MAMVQTDRRHLLGGIGSTLGALATFPASKSDLKGVAALIRKTMEGG